MKLLIAGPQEAETISSVLDRAASLYGTRRASLLDELRWRYSGPEDDPSINDVDVDPPAWLLTALADQFDCDPAKIESMKIPRSSWLLDPHNRDVYCPFCFDEDYRRIGTVYFRKRWMLSFLTHCPKHNARLAHWVGFLPNNDHLGRGVPVNGEVAQFRLRKSEAPPVEGNDKQWYEVLLEGWKRLIRCERSLLTQYERDPVALETTALHLRQFLVLFAGNWKHYRETPVMFFLSAFLSDQLRCGRFGLYSFPRKAARPAYSANEAWDLFLGQADPSWRRAATLLLTQLTSPEDPILLDYEGGASVASGKSYLSIPRENWLAVCFAQLPPTAVRIARHYAREWPTDLKRGFEQAWPEAIETSRDPPLKAETRAT